MQHLKRLFPYIYRIFKQGHSFFLRYGTGDLMAKAANDIQLVRELVGNWTISVVVMFFCAAVALYFMFHLSPSLTLLILPPIPIILIMAYYFAKRVFEKSMSVQEGFASLSDFTRENLNGIRTVQAQVQEYMVKHMRWASIPNCWGKVVFTPPCMRFNSVDT